MLKDRRIKIAWKAYLAELGVMQALERPSEAEIAERARRYFRWRLEEAVEVLGSDSSALAEVLNEMYALLIGEEEIVNWRPLSLEEARSRIGEPIVATAMETNVAHP
jgi:hypothetical protein